MLQTKNIIIKPRVTYDTVWGIESLEEFRMNEEYRLSEEEVHEFIKILKSFSPILNEIKVDEQRLHIHFKTDELHSGYWYPKVREILKGFKEYGISFIKYPIN